MIVYVFKIVFKHQNSRIFNRPSLLLLDIDLDIESMSSNELMQLFYQYFLLVMYLSLKSNWLCLLPNELAMTQNLCKVVFVEFGQSLQKENGKFTQTIVNFF